MNIKEKSLRLILPSREFLYISNLLNEIKSIFLFLLLDLLDNRVLSTG